MVFLSTTVAWRPVGTGARLVREVSALGLVLEKSLWVGCSRPHAHSQKVGDWGLSGPGETRTSLPESQAFPLLSDEP